MASSSLSQESLDIDDYNTATRRSRVRPLRSRVCVHKNESIETDERDLEEELDSFNDGKENSDVLPMYSNISTGAYPGEHDSPTRMINRTKNQRGRITHMHKGKPAKDKRKLREKRRSTGVVHLASTESTGDSLDDDSVPTGDPQTRRNTSYNEVIDADNPQTPEEDRKSFSSRRNKSPSDLDADLEDNQDYDSTVSQSETNLTLIGQANLHMETATEIVPGSGSIESGVTTFAPPPPHHPVPHHHPPHHHHPHHIHHKPQPQRGVHFHEGTDQPDSTRAAMLKRTSAHDGMEARLLAKTVELEKLLEREREEKTMLQELLDQRDLKIAQLESQLALLNKDVDLCDEENLRLIQENKVLLRAMAQLSAQ